MRQYSGSERLKLRKSPVNYDLAYRSFLHFEAEQSLRLFTCLIIVIYIISGVFGTCAIASATTAAIGGLVLGAIEGAIIGAVERAQLKDTIKKLEEEVKKFGSLFEKYTETIYEVLAGAKMSEIV